MSSRRGAGEENILAMLERDSARRPGTRMSGVRLASYGAAAALAGILAGGVAWLAYDNHKTEQALEARHDAIDAAAPPVMADAAGPPLAPATAPGPTLDAPRTAVIVDESTRPRDTTLASAPPLVMLPPHELKSATPPAPAPRVVQERVQPKPVKPAASKAATRAVARKKADKAPKPAGRTARAAPAGFGATSKARLESAARTGKTAPAADTQVDNDVALISAIIQHSERHRGERDAAGACSGAKCPPKPARP